MRIFSLNSDRRYFTSKFWKVIKSNQNVPKTVGETEVCASHHGAGIVKKKFQSETEKMNIEVNIPDLIVISSEGYAAQRRSHCLGMFYNELAWKCWVQVDTETKDKWFSKFSAYRDYNGVWRINYGFDKNSKFLKN